MTKTRFSALLLLLVTATFFICSPALAAPPQNIIFSAHNQQYTIDDTSYTMDTTPQLVEGRVFVPLRFLGHALGLEDTDIHWDEEHNCVILQFPETQLILIPGEKILYANGEPTFIDVAPMMFEGRITLPAGFIAEALGYKPFWDHNTKSICINPSVDWITKLPEHKTPKPWNETNLDEEHILGTSTIVFPAGKDNNVYNAGIAAEFANGTILQPGEQFSYNRVVGIRSTGRGFIMGANAAGQPENGGGVCRTSTIIYQAAQNAGLEINERHPHIPPVWYTPIGTDATVVWGFKDLKFTNNLDHPITVLCGLDKKENGTYALYATIAKGMPTPDNH